MNNTQLPPLPPTGIVSSTNKASPVPASSAITIVAAVVREAPQNLRKIEPARQVEGRVVASDPQTRQTTISTPEGEITIETEIPLPPETEVIVTLYTQKNVDLANIAIAKREAEVAQELAEIIPLKTPAPPPPLVDGDVVIVIILPEDAPVATLPPKPVDATVKDIAAAIDEIVQTIISAKVPLASLPPLPPEILALKDAVIAGKTQEVLSALPSARLAEVTEFLVRPDITAAFDKKLTPQTLRTLETLNPLEVKAPPMDDNIFDIIKAQISSKITGDVQTEDAPAPAPPPALFNVMRSMMPLLENSDSVTEPLAAYIRQFMPRDTMAQIAKADVFATPLNMAEMRVIKVIPPGAPVPQIATNTGQIVGTVDAMTPKGFPLIKTETAHLVLRTPHDIAVGSTIIFDMRPLTADDIIAQSYSTTVMPLLQTADEFVPLFSKSWPAMQDALQTSSMVPAQAAIMQAFKDTMPSPNAKMVPATLFFMAALRMGNIENWLGAGTLQLLRDSGKRDVADDITRDFGKIAGQSKETLAGDWRMIAMPMLHDDQLSQIKMFIRHQQDPDNKDDKDAKPMTRFLLNLNLSRMGDLQIDGLMRQKRLDLILRSEAPLHALIRQDLMQAYTRALDQTGMQGALSFQVKAQNWVQVELPTVAGTMV